MDVEEGGQVLPCLPVRSMIGGNYARHDTSVRVALDPDTLQRFTINQREDPPPRPLNGEPAPRSRRRIEYNVIGESASFSSNTLC